MLIYLHLCLEFFRIGLFSFGGGYATLPFLYHIADVYKWYTPQQLSDMIAISSITPGPVGVNVATFAGFSTAGILGSLIATTSVILPSYVLVIIISKLHEKFKTNRKVQAAIYGLKPAGCGLLTAVALNIFKDNVTGLFAFFFFAVLLGMSFKQKRDPLFYLGISAIVGLIAGFFNLK
ncbi:TPA: chromate transporter [Candidatus Scatousia excrementigallinarum]|uniref:Chromate transporter n=1 Tax=Candidatus Scatousia excrementigallinarum TaxID=2840935 RepID=A0A9D1JNH9_9BACT|nr:chromate transporter [Candidatus Scatousia excrementigallinarum]